MCELQICTGCPGFNNCHLLTPYNKLKMALKIKYDDIQFICSLVIYPWILCLIFPVNHVLGVHELLSRDTGKYQTSGQVMLIVTLPIKRTMHVFKV